MLFTNSLFSSTSAREEDCICTLSVLDVARNKIIVKLKRLNKGKKKSVEFLKLFNFHSSFLRESNFCPISCENFIPIS